MPLGRTTKTQQKGTDSEENSNLAGPTNDGSDWRSHVWRRSDRDGNYPKGQFCRFWNSYNIHSSPRTRFQLDTKLSRVSLSQNPSDTKIRGKDDMKLTSRLGQGLGFVVILVAATAALAPSLLERITWFYDNWQTMAIGTAVIVVLTIILVIFTVRREDRQ